MDIGKAFSFVFEDENWVRKMLYGVGWTILCILILPFFVIAGYGVAVARNVRNGVENPLPEWDNYGDLFSEGFAVSMAQFVYALPATILMFVGGVTAGLGGATENEAIFFVGGGVMILLSCVAMLWMLALVAISPAIYIQYLKHGTFSSCMDFREVIRLTRENLSELLVAVLIIFGANMMLGVVMTIPCLNLLVGLASLAYITMFSGHIYGQLAISIIGGGKGDKFDDIIMPDDMSWGD
ncbi:MAG: DUF4013 domain-containing protein [Candidatus Promineifilaceae bacterium]